MTTLWEAAKWLAERVDDLLFGGAVRGYLARRPPELHESPAPLDEDTVDYKP